MKSDDPGIPPPKISASLTSTSTTESSEASLGASKVQLFCGPYELGVHAAGVTIYWPDLLQTLKCCLSWLGRDVDLKTCNPRAEGVAMDSALVSGPWFLYYVSRPTKPGNLVWGSLRFSSLLVKEMELVA